MKWKLLGVCCLAVLVFTSCSRNHPQPTPDNPRLPSGVVMRDVTFFSAALGRNMQYRAILPKTIVQGQKLPVVYLLHGGGGDFREWSNDSNVAQFAEQDLVLVMPEGNSSYYTNSATRPQDRYEDYIVHDLIQDVESRLPVAIERSKRAIVGVSMGGFGAVKIALKHPELFAFVGGLSSALDVPSRPFSIKRIGQWRGHRSIFGPWNSEVQHQNDPILLVRTADPSLAPYFYLACGQEEGLLPVNRQFAGLLSARHFRFEFHAFPGGHNWNQWNSHLAECFRSLLIHLAESTPSASHH